VSFDFAQDEESFLMPSKFDAIQTIASS
jgi:hypothetical protein